MRESVVSAKYLSGRETNTTFNPWTAIVSAMLFPAWCQECDEKVTMAEARADHILPHSKGGKTDSSNLQILCEGCNESKSSGMSTVDLQKVLTNKNNLSPEQIKQIAEILA